MKTWFRHSKGFVNLDDEHLFLTKTGNWLEVDGLKEKGVQKQNSFKKTGIQVFLALSFLAFGWMLYRSFEVGRISLVAIGGGAVLVYSVYKYLKPELGKSYEIPISKIQRIEISDETVNITFLNSEGKPDSELIRGVDEKGIEVFGQMGDEVNGRTKNISD